MLHVFKCDQATTKAHLQLLAVPTAFVYGRVAAPVLVGPLAAAAAATILAAPCTLFMGGGSHGC